VSRIVTAVWPLSAVRLARLPKRGRYEKSHTDDELAGSCVDAP
jgi:hypothetical protein